MLIISDPRGIERERKEVAVQACDASPASQALMARLEEPVRMPFPNETPLATSSSYLKRATAQPPDDRRIEILVVPDGLEEVEKSLDSTMNMDLEGKQVSVVSFGKDSGPHNLLLSNDDRRLVVSDYFLNEDGAGIIHFEGDHRVRVIKVTHNTLTEDSRFQLDFNTAFPTGPARPHGLAMK